MQPGSGLTHGIRGRLERTDSDSPQGPLLQPCIVQNVFVNCSQTFRMFKYFPQCKHTDFIEYRNSNTIYAHIKRCSTQSQYCAIFLRRYGREWIILPTTVYSYVNIKINLVLFLSTLEWLYYCDKSKPRNQQLSSYEKRVKGTVHPNMKIQSLSTHLFLCPPNISGASPQNGFAVFY